MTPPSTRRIEPGPRWSTRRGPTEVSVAALTTVETTVTFATPGRYTYICHLPGHEAYGMVGLVIVE